MRRPTISTRLLAAVALLCAAPSTMISAQTAAPLAPSSRSTYRVAGTVVSKVDGHPLPRVRVTLRDAKAPQKFESLVTSEDGKFEFVDVPAGKYDLHGSKHGYIIASYDQHEQFSSAIVTGAGVDTESLVLRLAPAAIISGKVLDENGDPVRGATVNIYFDDHSSGVDQIHEFRTAQTDDLGAYEIRPLMPGTYFLSASAQPWYAVHPNSSVGSEVVAGNFDRSLDVAYPLTYYADVTDADSATPVPVRGGERLEVDIHLNPVPALHLRFRVPALASDGHPGKGQIFPRLEQPTFDRTSTAIFGQTRVNPSGMIEMDGVPAGRYNVVLNGAGTALQMNGVDLTKDGEEIDTSRAEASSAVKISVQVPGEGSLPKLQLGLRAGRRFAQGIQFVDQKGEAEFQQVPAGRYELVIWGAERRYSISHISAEGAEVSGHSITIPAGSSPSISVALVSGSINVEGVAKRNGKPFAGAMIVLVPKDPENNRDLFRRDQSDLDGTFNLPDVVPGSYTVLAIENGWDLDWSRPAVIEAYMKGGRRIEVANHYGRPVNLESPVEVLPK